MSTAEIIANYVEHKRGLGMRFTAEAAILIAFARFVGNVALSDIRPAMISRFVDRNGICDETSRKKYHVLAGFFRFTVTRRLLKTMPMPNRARKCRPSSYTPYYIQRPS
jgi:hypothetical protein